MRNEKVKLTCIDCKQTRFRSRSILSHKTSGKCRSCSSIGNKRRYLGKPYNKELYLSSIYMSWNNIKTRCTNPNSSEYKRYGARGITMCEKWTTFSGFLEDMQSSYKDGLSIDRIDNNGNYCKENCKWSTPKEQANNRRSNRIITFKNKTKTLAEWTEFLGMKRTTIANRIDYCGWSIERALSTNVKSYGR